MDLSFVFVLAIVAYLLALKLIPSRRLVVRFLCISVLFIVVLAIENPFHALVRNTSCNGLLTLQVIVRVSGDCPSGHRR